MTSLQLPRRPPEQKEFIYSVLNLPTSASQKEIRERYRELSVVFHPDKQHDEGTKETAAKRFLEIQKAYEVLSDPFMREVYNVFGEEGLSAKWPAEIRSLPVEQLHSLLKQEERAQTRHRLERSIRPTGRLTCGFNASSLLDSEHPSWNRSFYNRWQQAKLVNFGVRHAVATQLNPKTLMSAAGFMSGGPGIGTTYNLLGTVRHQYSPRLNFEATASLFRFRFPTIKATYDDEENTVVIRSHAPYAGSSSLIPPLTVSFARRLFRDSLTQGVIIFHNGPQPQLTVEVVRPSPFNTTISSLDSPDDDAERTVRLGSLSGFGIGAFYWQYGIIVAGVATALKAEWGVVFAELALRVDIGLQYGFTGPSLSLSGLWEPTDTLEMGTSVALSDQGVFLTLDFSYIKQRFSIPIVLSQHYDAGIALWTAVIPSTLFALGYHFIVRPRRRAQRAAYFRTARKELDQERSHVPREAAETAALLKETAHKHTQIESTKGGLVILEGTYGPEEINEEATSLMVDVTVALQALVNNSQVYIPGHRTKSGLQGFYDPAPTLPKSLRVRYLFRGRLHYAEITDHTPVVLPLEDHLVGEP